MPMETHEGSDEHEADKVIVRSNGTITYTGKDIAYQLWKLGQVDLNFFYKPFRAYADGRAVWTTTSRRDGGGPERARSFGGGRDRLQRHRLAAVLPAGGRQARRRRDRAAGRRVCERALSYEMVALTPAAAEELGIELSAEENARAVRRDERAAGLRREGRRLHRPLEANALREVAGAPPELSDEERRASAHTLAVGALRYFLLKWTRNSVIAFDFKEALSFKGETGPYCQYAAVRANSIFRKLATDELSDAQRLVNASSGEEASARVRRGVRGRERG